MDKKMIAIIAVVAVAIVAIAACVLLLGKSSNPAFEDVEIDEELQGKIYVVNADDESERVLLEDGAKTYKNTKIVTDGIRWETTSIIVNHEMTVVTATMQMFGGTHDVEFMFRNVESIDAFFVADNLEIPLGGIKKGVSVMVDYDPPMLIERIFAGTWNLVDANVGFYDDEGNPVYRAIDIAGSAVIEAIDESFCTLTFNNHTSTCVFDGNRLITTDVGGFSSTAVATALGDDMYITHVMPGYGGIVIKFQRQEGPIPPNADKPDAKPADEPYVPKEGTVMDAFSAEKYVLGNTEDYTDRNYKLTVLEVEDAMIFYRVDFVMDDVPCTFHFVAVRVMPESYIAICEEPGEHGETFVDMVNFTEDVVYTSSYVIEDYLIAIWNVAYGDEDKAYVLETDMTDMTFAGVEWNITHNGGVVPLEPDTVIVSASVLDQSKNVIEVQTTTEDDTHALWAAVVLKDPLGYHMTIESFALYGLEMYTGYYLCTMNEDMTTMTVCGCLDGEDGSFAVFKQILHPTLG